MEAISFAVLGLSEGSLVTIVLALISLAATLLTVGYKYKKADKKPADNQATLFNQVNTFIEQQKADRDDLRKELNDVKAELEEVRVENEILRKDNRDLRDQIHELQVNAKKIAQLKVKEDNKKEN